MSEVIFGRVAKPRIEMMIVAKPYDGAGYTRLAAPRRLVGVCEHITAGRGTAAWYAGFFGTGGQRALDALVDFVVDRTGTIGQLNDPWGTRSPWANGRLDGLEGDGPAFLAKFGVNGVNDRLASIEHEGTAIEDWTTAEWESAVKLTAWLFDQIGVRWDTYPVHQLFNTVTHLLHSEFTGKGGNGLDECPGRYLKTHIDQFQADVRGILKAAQISVPIANPPKPAPVQGVVYPDGLNAKAVSAFFGKVRQHEADGSIRKHGYNEKGVVSLAYLARGSKESVYPPALDWYTFAVGEGKRDLITFGNGWVLFRDRGRAGWRWLDEQAA